VSDYDIDWWFNGSYLTCLVYLPYLAKHETLKIVNFASNCTYPNARS